MSSDAIDRLVRDALAVPFRGWDFTALGDRLVLEPPSWSFEQMVDDAASRATSMLDMGTGGGEFLSARRRAAGRNVATEGWPPNVPIAAARLAPLGVAVVHDEGAVDNLDQEAGPARGRLPFRPGAFDLVVNRHEAFTAAEVRRVLRPGCTFLTQQGNAGARQFHELLGLAPPPDRVLHLDLASAQLARAGFDVQDGGEGTATAVFADVGALAWYLANVPWAVPDFSPERHHDALVALHGRPIRVAAERFWLRAVAPGATTGT
jgi:SAM-dependent methyltransferase